MATALLPPFQKAFAALVAEHGDLIFVDALMTFLVGGPRTGIPVEPPASARRPPYETPAPLLIQAELRKLCTTHGTERGMQQVREALLSYALSGARQAMVRRSGKISECPECQARAESAAQVDAAIQRVATSRPQAAPGTDATDAEVR